jgi:hypothetical protein
VLIDVKNSEIVEIDVDLDKLARKLDVLHPSERTTP